MVATRETIRDRIHNLAKVLGMTPTYFTWVRRDSKTKKWWLEGCKEGDQPLPQAYMAEDVRQALNSAEEWIVGGE